MPSKISLYDEDRELEEVESLPVLNVEDIVGRELINNDSGRWPTMGSDLMKAYDYAINEPVRAGVASYLDEDKGGFREARGLWGAAKQYFNPDDKPPTWTQIAQDVGFSPLTFRDAAMKAGLQGYYPDISPADIGGFVGESVLDPTNLIGGGAVMGGLKYGDDALRGAKNLGDDLGAFAEGSPVRNLVGALGKKQTAMREAKQKTNAYIHDLQMDLYDKLHKEFKESADQFSFIADQDNIIAELVGEQLPLNSERLMSRKPIFKKMRDRAKEIADEFDKKNTSKYSIKGNEKFIPEEYPYFKRDILSKGPQ